MTLKYENQETEQACLEQTSNRQNVSPLYGDDYMPFARESRVEQKPQPTDVAMLREPEVIQALKYAEEVYSRELMRLGYSPLTIGTYSSSAGRFIQFLEFGRVIPDREQ